MEQAIVMARQNPAGPFGCVIVHQPSQSVLAAGVNHTRDNPIWHGEMDALSRLKPGGDLINCVLYTTAEPCSMCQSAICWTGLGTVVCGSSIPFLKSLGWSQIDVRAKEIIERSHNPCSLIEGVLTEKCDQLFRTAASKPKVSHETTLMRLGAQAP